jgi:hypothetical protein
MLLTQPVDKRTILSIDWHGICLNVAEQVSDHLPSWKGITEGAIYD